jgi:two-component system, chemotaxis family, chemotaxis protein CheY
LKVLVLDSDVAVRALMGMLLKGMGLTETVWATTDGEARTLLKQKSTGLIISAWLTPGRDGLELLMSCKQDPSLRSIPFVLMGDMHDQATAAMKAGADAYLVKPFSDDELQEILRKMTTFPKS